MADGGLQVVRGGEELLHLYGDLLQYRPERFGRTVYSILRTRLRAACGREVMPDRERERKRESMRDVCDVLADRTRVY